MTVLLKIIERIIPYLFKYLESRKADKRKLKIYRKVYSILLYLLNSTTADRVIVLKAIWKTDLNLSNEIYSIVEFEVYNDSLKPASREWNKQLIDQAYQKYLIELKEKGHIILQAHTVQGILKNLYIKNGIKHSKVYKLHTTPRSMLYLSINFKKTDVVTPTHLDIIRHNVNQLRNLFKP